MDPEFCKDEKEAISRLGYFWIDGPQVCMFRQKMFLDFMNLVVVVMRNRIKSFLKIFGGRIVEFDKALKVLGFDCEDGSLT